MANGDEDDKSQIISIYDLGEITNTKIPEEKVWNKQVTCQAKRRYESPHMFLNKTNMFVTQDKFIKCFDFWNC